MADVVIRGMDLPLRCINCPFNTYYHAENRCLANRGKKIEFAIGRDRGTNCPLVPLPKGHGRLIDADKLTPDMGYFITGGSGTVGSMYSLPAYSQQNIDNAPTIVPAEGGGEVKGEKRY